VARYFVAGATGFLGGEIVKQLRGRGHKVVALIRSPEKVGILNVLGVDLRAGDILDRASVAAAMAGVDGVFHVAGWYKVGVASPMAERINVEGTRNVLETMRDLGIPAGVYTSTVAVFSDTKGAVPDERYRYEGPWLSTYERTKWQAQYEVAQPLIDAGLPLRIVMPGLIYGPGDTSGFRTLIIQLLKGWLPLAPRQTAFCWSHLDDSARAHILAMEKGRPGETYIVTGPQHSLEEALDVTAALARVHAPLLHPGPLAMRSAAKVSAFIERFRPLPPGLASESLRSLAGTTYFGDSTKAARELGFAPCSLEVGMATVVEHELRQMGKVWIR
jgi:nucleoside-diphosphate-sugar epimerase